MGWFSQPACFCLPRYLPVAAVAALLEAGDDLAQVCGAPVAADDILMSHHNEMQMVGHDDVVLHFQHGIVLGDAGRQLLLYHLSYSVKHYMRSLWVAVGLCGISFDAPKWLPSPFLDSDGNMVGAPPVVVLFVVTPSKMVLTALGWLFRCMFLVRHCS